MHENLTELRDAIVEPDQNVTELVAPRKSKSRRKKIAHQEKALVIREGTLEVVRSPPVPAGDKVKKVVKDVLPPSKKQKNHPFSRTEAKNLG